MIYQRVVDLIKNQPDRLTSRWSEHIKRSEVTKTYAALSVEELTARHTRLFQNLARWLQQTMGRHELNRYFYELGRERYLEGFPLCEVNYAVLLAKRDFRDLIHSQGLLDSALEFYQAMEVQAAIDQYFDLGNFYIIRGYLQGIYSKLEKSNLLSDAAVRNFILTADPDLHPEGVKERSGAL